MAGHRKWAKVKHFKGAIDAKRGRIFAKLSRETTIAAKRGGGDSDVNPRLRMARLRCQMAHLPKDNRNRRAADTRRLVTQSGDSIATADSVRRRFHRKGQIIVSREAAPENQLMELALAAGAEGFTVKEIYSNAEFPD